ncbi:MAG: class I SAM-dependent methyltransferase [Candidatus Komeilibacteria bacterium]|nr:class I SAM-dependent methyltransferase [Candidatus Komeilibacteria bacterium]
MDVNQVKSVYNSQKPEANYEYERWFKNPIKLAGYEMSLKSIKVHVLPDLPQGGAYLELGPGAGTWTKVILIARPGLEADLVDLSSSMLNQAKKNLSGFSGINYFENDFLDFSADKKYQAFFSSRVFEYLPDQPAAAAKIAELLPSGGMGWLITKTPKYFFNRLLGRKINPLHNGQIAPTKLHALLAAAGFKEIKMFPVAFSFPLFKSAGLNKFCHSLFYRLPLNFISQFLSESYLVKFKKS